MPPEVFVVLHVLCTCDDHGVSMAKDQAEVIELAWLMVPAASLEMLEPQNIVIKPANTPITQLCTSLTGLSWDSVRDLGFLFADAVSRLDLEIRTQIIDKGKTFAFAMSSSWDLRVQVQREARDKGVTLPTYLQHPCVYDLKLEYQTWQAQHPEAAGFGSGSVINICSALDIDLSLMAPESGPGYFVPKRAKDHVRVSHAILRRLYSTLGRPVDMEQDTQSFFAERSRVLYLSNLAYDTTQAELELWFTRYGGRPTGFRTLQTPEASKYLGSGFAVFATHAAAAELLGMNGRALNDRVIEVLPLSFKVLEYAQEILVPFPQSKNKPRPGDWTCPLCGFLNFQRRTACLRCSFPATSAAVISDSMVTNIKPRTGYSNTTGKSSGNSIPFRAGDWKCENCYYHNFAKNLYCLRCGITRVNNNNSNAKMVSAASLMILPGMNQFLSTMLSGMPLKAQKVVSQGTGGSFGGVQDEDYLSWSMGHLSMSRE